MRARLASGAPRISRWPNLEILVPRPLARRVATPRESSLTVLPRASPRRRSRRAATKHHRNTILRPLVEDEADTAPIGTLPARLSHLHGPVGLPAASPPGARSGGITATPPRPEFAPSTPANRSTLRGASGTLLMGPWNGAFARADDSADPKPDAARRRPDAVARLDDDAREHLADVIFTGPDETPLDHESVALEKVLEDALTGRVVVAPDLDDGESRGAPSGPEIGADYTIGASSSSSGTRRASSAAIGPPGRRTNSAPAATSRRVGAMRVSARRRTPPAAKRAHLARLADARREIGGGGGRGGSSGGRGAFFGMAPSARNNGPRNTAGARFSRPSARSGGAM